MFLLSLSNARTSTVRPFKFAFYLLSEWKSSSSSSKKIQPTTIHGTHNTLCAVFFSVFSLLCFYSLLFSLSFRTLLNSCGFFTQNVSMSSKPDCMYVLKRKTKTNSLLVQHLVPVIVCVAVFSTLSVLDSCVLLLFAFAVSVASIFDSILSDFFFGSCSRYNSFHFFIFLSFLFVNVFHLYLK